MCALALSDSNTSLGTSLTSTLFFDARPTEDLRVYGSAKAAYPFSTETADGVSVPNLTGGTATMMPNHHITKPVFIGEIQDDGQFDVVWQTTGTVVGDAWSDFLPSSADLTADWTAPLACGNYNVKTGKCSGQNYE